MAKSDSHCGQTALLAGVSGNVDSVIKLILPQRDDIIKQAVKTGGK